MKPLRLILSSLLVLLLRLALLDCTDLLESGLSLLEGLLHAFPDAVEDLSAGSLLLLDDLAILLDVGNSLFASLLLLLLLGGTSDLVEGIKSVHENAIGKRVLLGATLNSGRDLGSAELGLDLVGVDDSGEVSAVHDVAVEDIATLLDVGSAVVAEDSIECLEGIFGPDDEAAEVTTRGELEEVNSVHVDKVNTGEVSGGSLDTLVLLTVDDQRASAENVSGVSQLTVASSDFLGISGSLDVFTSTNVLEGGEEGLGGVNVEGVNNEGKLGDIQDFVASGKNEGSNS
jgi:hypothetical protein